MKEIPFVLLIFFSAFTMNPVLQCALGINAAPGNPGRKPTIIKLGVIFITVILLWVIFSMVIPSIVSGIFIYVLLFPVSYMAYNGLDFLVSRYLFEIDSNDDCSVRFPGGITAAVLFICLNIANNFIEAAALSFGFAAGTLLVFLILFEIRRRAAFEEVPRFLRGKPLILISMGMLSLVFSTVSLLLFRMIRS